MISRLLLLVLSFVMTLYIVVSLATFFSARHEKDFHDSLNKDFSTLQTSLHSVIKINTFMTSEEIKSYTQQIVSNQTITDENLKPVFQELLHKQAKVFKEQLSETRLTRESGEPNDKSLAEYFKGKEGKIKSEELLPYFEEYKKLSDRIDNYGAWKSSFFFKSSLVISLCVLGLVILVLFLSLVFQHESFETSIKYTTYGTLIVNGVIYLLLFMIFLFISP